MESSLPYGALPFDPQRTPREGATVLRAFVFAHVLPIFFFLFIIQYLWHTQTSKEKIIYITYTELNCTYIIFVVHARVSVNEAAAAAAMSKVRACARGKQPSDWRRRCEMKILCTRRGEGVRETEGKREIVRERERGRKR